VSRGDKFAVLRDVRRDNQLTTVSRTTAADFFAKHSSQVFPFSLPLKQRSGERGHCVRCMSSAIMNAEAKAAGSFLH